MRPIQSYPLAPFLSACLLSTSLACLAPQRTALPNVAVDRDPYRQDTAASDAGSLGEVRPSPTGTPTARAPETENRRALAFPTGDPATSLVLCERKTPATVTVGEMFRYQLRLSNLTDAPLERVRLTERLPESVTVHSADPQPAAVEPGRLLWLFDELAPGEHRVLEVSATQTATAPVTHVASVVCDPVLVTRTAVESPSVRVHLTAPSEALLCETIPVRVTVTNTGKKRTRGMRFELPLPEGIVSAAGEASAFVDVPPLELGSSHTAPLRLESAHPGSFVLRTAEGASGARSNVVTMVVNEPRLTLALDAPAPAQLADDLVFHFELRNEGDVTARETRLTLRLPPGAALLAGSEGARGAAGKVTWELGDLHVGEARTVDAALSALAPGALPIHVLAEAKCAEPVESETEAQVLIGSNLFLDVEGGSEPVPVGTEHTYVVRVKNYGASPMDDVRVVVRLSGMGTLIQSTGSSPGASSGGDVRFDYPGTLVPGEEAQWNLTVRAVAPGSGALHAELSAAEVPLIDQLRTTDYYE